MALDLLALRDLPGAADENFEVFTRAVVSRRYGAFGTLRERRQQPGVEFYLRVEHPGPLGDPRRVWGWSCKWFMLGKNNELSRAQRDQIVQSIDKAIKHVHGLTDFVLCLPLRPSKADENWIDGIGPARGIRSKLWAGENYDAELAGYDELRATFFGDLVLTPDTLAKIHERSIAPIEARWVPGLHTSSHAERQINRVLLKPAEFDQLDTQVTTIEIGAGALRAALPVFEDEGTRTRFEAVAEGVDGFVAGIRAIVTAGRGFRPAEVRERITDQRPPGTSRRELQIVVHELRKRRHPAALVVSGLTAVIRDVIKWLESSRGDAEAPMLALVAAAGMGKTHLAAQLTAPDSGPTAGIFIPGSRLRAGLSLDELARRVPGLKVDRFEDLLWALDTAGARAGCRVPIVVDGLNEAERPTEWRALLAELIPALADYPNVLLIVTLREALAGRVVPDPAVTIVHEWDRPEVGKMVDAYFEYYLIHPGEAWLPWAMFHNPLFVRMYCEAANPVRENPVGAEALPTSLVGVFERYRDSVITRLADDPARVSIPADQIKRRLATFAYKIWEQMVRTVPSDEAQKILDGGETNWDESLLRRLVEEGVLFREEVEGSDETTTGILFDRFAGYLVADTLLRRMTYAEVEQQLGEAPLWAALLGEDAHPLGEDITVGLIGLVPRRFSGHHLWRVAPPTRRSLTLAYELDAESEFLDTSTVDALAEAVASWQTPRPRSYGRRHPFDRLWEVRAAPAHRLNAAFLDRVLRLLPLAERDSKWSEWIRHHADDGLVRELGEQIDEWTNDLSRTEIDDLKALVIAWLHTSTNRGIRDLATKALQRYGQPEPKRLFDLATRMLDVDDPYVLERIVGAAFGAASAHQLPDPGGPFEQALAGWLEQLRARFLEAGSVESAHELIRGYVRTTFEFAGTLHASSVPEGIDPGEPSFAPVQDARVMGSGDPNAAECERTFGMDFENYVIGSKIEGRRNYDFEHEEFQRARGEVLARVWELGWRANLLSDLDQAIANDAGRFGHSRRSKVERYGKKYGWIAYYELVGRLSDVGKLGDRWFSGPRNVSPDIDPSFPDEPPIASSPLPAWAPPEPVDQQAWLRTGKIHVPPELWAPTELHGVPGGWLLAEGFVEHKCGELRVFGFFRTLLLEPADVDGALALINETAYLGNSFFSELPTIRGVFAGEVPWSSGFDIEHDEEPSSGPALRRNWQEEGIRYSQVAVELDKGEGGSQVSLDRSYDLPSYAFAAKFGLRRLPGTLDLVGLDGTRASAVFRAGGAWDGHLLFLRSDLLHEFAGERRIVQAGWGERGITADWHDEPDWLHEVYRDHEHIWREVRAVTMPPK